MIDEDMIVEAFPPLLGLLGMVGGLAGRFLVSGLVSAVILGIVRVLAKPMFIVGFILVLMYYPEAIQWIFMKIGEIQIRIFGVMLAIILPEIFTTADVDSWSQLWNSAISVFPTEITDVMAALDLAGNLGMVTSCLTSGFTIKIYMRLVKRMGFM